MYLGLMEIHNAILINFELLGAILCKVTEFNNRHSLPISRLPHFADLRPPLSLRIILHNIVPNLIVFILST